MSRDRLQQQLDDMLRAIFGVILDRPELIEWNLEIAKHSVLIAVKCRDRTDCARVIGMGGETIRAIRRLVTNGARRNGIYDVIVNVVDPSGRGSKRQERVDS